LEKVTQIVAQPNPCFAKRNAELSPWKIIVGYLRNLKQNLPKVNCFPTVENSPNLVTPILATKRDFLFPKSASGRHDIFACHNLCFVLREALML
jgi:hypothetical protein